MNLDIRDQGAGRTIRRKYRVIEVDYCGIEQRALAEGWVLHPKYLARDNAYRHGGTLSDSIDRLHAHILDAWRTAGGEYPEPPHSVRVVTSRSKGSELLSPQTNSLARA